MKTHFQKMLFVVIALCLIVSCSKEKEDNSPVDAPVGGDAFKMQFVTIDLPNTSLPNAEYHGILEGSAITITKSDDHTLLFMMPSNVALGNQNLEITDLNNLKITYNVKDVVLPDTPNATISPFQNNLNTFQSTPSGDASTLKAVNSFNQVYDNASADDKIKVATLYYANKTLFDDLILNDYSTITGKFNLGTIALLNKHQAAVLGMAIGAIMIAAPTFTFGEKVLGAALICVSAKKAFNFGSEFVTETVNTIGLEADNIPGENNRNPLTGRLQIQDNVVKNVVFNTIDRTVIASDSNKTNTGTALFFKYYIKYNDFVAQANPIIQWINNNIPFADFNLLSVSVAPSSSPSINNPVDATTFGKMVFTINSPNLSLQSATLLASGQLSLKIKIVGTPATTPVQSYLNYTYNDEFSNFSGRLPIVVNADYVITNVSFVSWTNIGTQCPGYYQSGAANITLRFNNLSTPSTGYIKWNIYWDNENDGIFEGNSGVGTVDITTLAHSGNEFYMSGYVYCWGVNTTVLRGTFQYVTSTGIESTVYSMIVPRP